MVVLDTVVVDRDEDLVVLDDGVVVRDEVVVAQEECMYVAYAVTLRVHVAIVERP